MENDIVGEAGAGLVKVTYRNNIPIKVEIDDLIFKESDKQLVSELFVAALLDAEKKMNELIKHKYSKLSSSQSLNDLFSHLLPPNK